MADDFLRYDRMIEEAMLDVARRSLTLVAERGMPGEHHFYVAFRTGAPGVSLPKHLAARYPDEMTIVLQHQFYDLSVDERGFQVTLSFNRKMERLAVPFAALTSFTDPSANFRLQFRAPDEPAADLVPDPPASASGTTPPAPAPKSGADVVSLDSFRKK